MNTFLSLLALAALVSAASATFVDSIDGPWCVNYNFTNNANGYMVKIVTQGTNVTISTPKFVEPTFAGTFTSGSGNTRPGAAAVGWAPIYRGVPVCGKVVATIVIADENTIYGVNTAIPTDLFNYHCDGWGGSGFVMTRGDCK
eukprot:TRINITY_DN8949_c0_g1_i1.p1 TRINITY_DN8949_c0_g1~~TRINITY_DN8949_c0_g1_i1.p1  ORF type:complete len:143 (+),score=22.09 TRINITY_DN8949_c0_g1_i1:14-442(+)